MKISIVQYRNSATSNSATLNSATLNAMTMNSGSLIVQNERL